MVTEKLATFAKHATGNMLSSGFVGAFHHAKTLFYSFGARLVNNVKDAAPLVPLAKRCEEQVAQILANKGQLVTAVEESVQTVGFSMLTDLINGKGASTFVSEARQGFVEVATCVSEKVAGNCTLLVPKVEETYRTFNETFHSLPKVNFSSAQDFFLSMLDNEEACQHMYTALTDTLCDITFELFNEKVNPTVAEAARQITKVALAATTFAACGLALETAMLSYCGGRTFATVMRFAYSMQKPPLQVSNK